MTITKHALAYSENSPVGRYPWLPRPVRTRGKVAVDAFRWWRSPRRQLLLRMPRAAVAAEIGGWTGDFSERIRQYTSPLMLHLIDPWTFQPTYRSQMYGGRIAKNQGDMDRVYGAVQQRFASAGDVTIHRGTSADVLPTFSDGFFDWVYIDGNMTTRTFWRTCGWLWRRRNLAASSLATISHGTAEATAALFSVPSGDRTFEAGVVIGHDKLNAVEAAGLEAFDEGRNDP